VTVEAVVVESEEWIQMHVGVWTGSSSRWSVHTRCPAWQTLSVTATFVTFAVNCWCWLLHSSSELSQWTSCWQRGVNYFISRESSIVSWVLRSTHVSHWQHHCRIVILRCRICISQHPAVCFSSFSCLYQSAFFRVSFTAISVDFSRLSSELTACEEWYLASHG